MTYIENPKTKGSGIIACIPQKGTCPNNCADCFFQSGRSYLEPLEDNLPNMPPTSWNYTANRILRVNDGNDSNVDREIVMNTTSVYENKFYNTAINEGLKEFDAPVVLTINPSKLTDFDFWRVDPIPKNLMFVRIRTNVWNLKTVVIPAVKYYTEKEVPVVLTFMAYYDTPVPEEYKKYYIWKERTLNAYWVIKTKVWERIMRLFKYEAYVYSCSKVEGEKAIRACARCGNCIREYFVTMERMRNG